MVYPVALRTESVGGDPQHVPYSACGVGEVVEDAKYGMKQMGLNRSNEELDTFLLRLRRN